MAGDADELPTNASGYWALLADGIPTNGLYTLEQVRELVMNAFDMGRHVAAKTLDGDYAASCDLNNRLSKLLTGTADALKGKPEPLHLHSWHDLPEVAQKLVDRLAAAESALENPK